MPVELDLIAHLTRDASIGRLIGTTTVGNNCVIGSACTTDLHEKMEDNTVIYGSDYSRRTQEERNAVRIKNMKVYGLNTKTLNATFVTRLKQVYICAI
jgi:UDP-3-O-[3-hydroxymyristoyl] glucosamine N-acyltransferase